MNEEKMELPSGLVIIRDLNRTCQETSVYALIEGEARPRKINRARRWQGGVEIRTAARDIWMGPVASFEWVNGLGFPVSCQARDIRS